MRMDVTFVQNAKDDIDGDDRRKDQQQFVAERTAEGERRALKTRLQAGGHIKFRFGFFNRIDGIAKRRAGGKVKGNRRCRKLPQMIDLQRRVFVP